jgi:hypothetical protein
MPTINVYLSENEMKALLNEANKKNQRLPVFIRQIIKDYLISQGYGAE